MHVLGLNIPLFQLRGPFEELANIFILCVFLHVLRLIVGFFSAVFLEFCCRTGPVSEHTRKKISSNAWYGLYYTCAVISGLLLMYQTEWTDRETICSYEYAPTSLLRYPWLYIYQCTQVAFYLNYFFAMVTGIDVKRKDQTAFIIHHVATIALIIFSRNWGYMRVQLAILLVHDAADPFLHYAKLIKLARPNAQLIPDVLLVIFAIVFYATRWAIFPAVLVDSCRDMRIAKFPYDWHLVDMEFPLVDRRYFGLTDDYAILWGHRLSFVGMSLGLLYLLFSLHLYWGFYILRMAWVKLNPPAGGYMKDDMNSDDEGEMVEPRSLEKVKAI